MKFTLDNQPVDKIDTPCIVIGIVDGEGLTGSAAAIDQSSNGLLKRLVESRDAPSGIGKVSLLHDVPGLKAKRVLVIGFGKREKLDRSRFNQACMSAGKFLRNHPMDQCHICLHEIQPRQASAEWSMRQAAIAIGRANYRYTATKPLKNDAPVPLKTACFQGPAEQQPVLDTAEALIHGYNMSRRLGELPPNICTPAFLAQESRKIAEDHAGVELEVLGEDDMADLGMDALLGVSRGSTHPARLIVMKYSAGKADQSPVVLVGKGITFDSGGLSLKSPDNMTQMKYDMCGAAGVIGAFLACVKLQLKVNVICVVAAAENMPDGNAYRPGDVITSMSGKTIEVLNTDAEGRLVLCDALTYSERFNPHSIIDVATLTGACVIALGHHASGLISNDDSLADALIDAGEDMVDRAWRLPLWDDYQSQLDTPFADMKNVGGMSAGVLTAGCFLSRFTEKQRWAHLDIAGSAWKWNANEGATGRPVGLLTNYLMNIAAGGKG